MAPLLGLGISFLTDLISKHGEALVTEGVKAVTGIDLNQKELTPQDKQCILDAEFKLKELDYKKLELSLNATIEDNRHTEATNSAINANTSDARDMNVSIQSSTASSNLAKNAAYYLDLVIVAATVVLAFTLFVIELPLANKELAYMMFGSLVTLTGTIINFHRGSSQSSADKQVAIGKILKSS